MRDHDDLVRQATSQHGLLSIRQLRELGFGEPHQRNLIRRGLLRSVARGVVALTGAPATWEQRQLIAVLTPGAPAVLSHRSALRIHGLRTRWNGVELSVRYPAERRIPGAIVHRSVDLEPGDCEGVKGLTVTTPARTLCDAGLHFPPREVQLMLDHSIADGMVTRSEMAAMRERIGESGRNGVASLDAALDGLPPGAEETDSSGEIALLRLIADRGLPEPARQHPVRVGAKRYRLDLSYPDALLALEYDGRDIHTRYDRFVDDRRRQNDIASIGWTVMRYTHEELRDRPSVVARQIRAHLAL